MNAKLFGFLTIACGITYIVLKNKEGENSKLDGFDINIDTDRLLDGTLAATRINPMYRDKVKFVAHKLLDRAMK